LYLVRFSLCATIDIASSFDIGVEKNVGNNNEFCNAKYMRMVVTMPIEIIGNFLSTLYF